MRSLLDLVHTPARFVSPLSLLGLGVGMGASLGCGPGGPGGDGAFRIVSVAFDGDSRITLTFSEPIANASQIDPNDFRLSLGRTSTVTYSYMGGPPMTYAYTGYRDLAGYNYNYNYDNRFAFASASLGGPDQLVLETEVPLGTDECQNIASYIAQFEMYAEQFEMYGYTDAKFDMAMFLHYAAGMIPVENADGETIADIGRDWVLDDSNYASRQGYGFTQLIPQLRIPCP